MPPKAQVEEMDVKLPTGEMVTVRAPSGLSDDQIHSMLMKKMPEAFRPPAPGPPKVDMQRQDLLTGNPERTDDAIGAGVLKSGAGMVGGMANLIGKVIPQDAQTKKDIGDIQEFATPSGAPEKVGKYGTDVAAMLMGGGAAKGAGAAGILKRAAATGGINAAQTGEPSSFATGAALSAGGDVLSSAVKGLQTSIKGMKDPSLKNLALGFRDALQDVKPVERRALDRRSDFERRVGDEPRGESAERRGDVERRDVVRRSDVPRRSDATGDKYIDELRTSGERSGGEQRGNFDRRLGVEDRQGSRRVGVDVRSADRREYSTGRPVAEQAIANVESVWQSTPKSVKNIPGARRIYQSVMNNLQSGKQVMPQELETKYEALKRAMDNYAVHRATFGGIAGGLYGEHKGNPVTGALEGAALGASPSLAVRGIPIAGRIAPKAKALPPIVRGLFTDGGSK